MNFDQQLNQLVEQVTNMNPDDLATGILILAGMIIGILVGFLVVYLLTALGYCRLFEKAGISGWKAFIPFYGEYNRFKMSWKAAPFFWVYLVACFTQHIFFGWNILVLDIIALVVAILSLVIAIKLEYNVAKSFGKGIGWTILLILFQPIAVLVLGFGKSEYVGNPANK